MSIVLDGTTGITTPGLTNTGSETVVNLTTTGNTILGDASTDTLNVGNGGLIKDASGNVGIGVTSPTSRLHVSHPSASTNAIAQFTNGTTGTGAGNGLYVGIDSTNTATIFNFYNSALQFGTNGATKMLLDTSGNLGIGTTSPATKLHISTDGTYDPLRLQSTQSGYERSWTIGPNVGVAGLFVFRDVTAGQNRVAIDTSGNLLVGTTSTAGTVVGARMFPTGLIQGTRSESTNAATQYDVYSTGAAAYRFYVGMGGTIYATSTTISAISDIRFKENVRDLDAGLSEVMALKPRLYDWKEGKGANTKNARGFIAQEFEEVFPDLIDEWKDPAPEGEEPYKSVRQDLIPVLVKAIQEQQALITQLTDRITALENK